jgi:hypothetical protein
MGHDEFLTLLLRFPAFPRASVAQLCKHHIPWKYGLSFTIAITVLLIASPHITARSGAEWLQASPAVCMLRIDKYSSAFDTMHFSSHIVEVLISGIWRMCREELFVAQWTAHWQAQSHSWWVSNRDPEAAKCDLLTALNT